MDVPRSEDKTAFVRAVKRAFADALVAEIRRSRLGRKEVAESSGVSRACLQHLLAATRQTTIGTLISIAAGLGTRPESLVAKTMENLSRIQSDYTSVIRTPPSEEQE